MGFALNESVSSPSSPYRVLALETRPQSLTELVGQETIRKVLGDLIQSGRLPHALLFTGTRGTGKTSTARIFAKSLCCDKGPTTEPCQVCEHCLNITASSHEDVLEIDGASNTGIDKIRELRESARFFPKTARHKIFIIDEVHMLSVGAFNALLKTLEEPPPQVVFVLATTEVNKVPLTVRSRCMILPFRKVDLQVLADHLGSVLKKRELKADPDALKLVAREGRGSFRDALSLLEQTIPYAQEGHLSLEDTSRALGLQDRDFARSIFSGICKKDSLTCLNTLAEADRAGLDLSRLLQDTAELFRHAVVLNACEAKNDKSKQSLLFDELLDSELQEIEAISAPLSQAALAESFRLLQQSISDVLKANNQRPWAEIAVLDCIERSNWMNTEDLLAGLQSSPTTTPLPNSSQQNSSSPRMGAMAAAQPPPVEPQKPQPTHSPDVDLDLLKKWTHALGERSLRLGAKLRHAQFDAFNSQKVVLASIPSNQIYSEISGPDHTIMVECLERLGVKNATFTGFQVLNSQKPLNVQKKKTL